MPLMGMFMFGNLLRRAGGLSPDEHGGGPLMDMVTIFLGLSVGASMQAETFLSYKPLLVFGLGYWTSRVHRGGILTVKS